MAWSHLTGGIEELNRKRIVGDVGWVEGEGLMVLRMPFSLRRRCMFDEVRDLIDHSRVASARMTDILPLLRQWLANPLNKIASWTLIIVQRDPATFISILNNFLHIFPFLLIINHLNTLLQSNLNIININRIDVHVHIIILIFVQFLRHFFLCYQRIR